MWASSSVPISGSKWHPQGYLGSAEYTQAETGQQDKPVGIHDRGFVPTAYWDFHPIGQQQKVPYSLPHMDEVDHKASLAPRKDSARELLFQPVQRLPGRDDLMRSVDQAATAGAFHPEQILEWNPDLYPVMKDLQPHERGKPHAGTAAHGSPQMLHRNGLYEEPSGMEGIAADSAVWIS